MKRVSYRSLGSSLLCVALQNFLLLWKLFPNCSLSYHKPRGGSTQTGLALKYVLRKGFPGGRNATAAARIVILLSDGRSQGNVVQAAAELKETGAVLFAVGLRYPTYVYLLPLSKTWGENYCAALKNRFCSQMGGATCPGQWAHGEPCLLRWAFPRRCQRAVHNTVHLLRVQRHTSRSERCCIGPGIIFTDPFWELLKRKRWW